MGARGWEGALLREGRERSAGRGLRGLRGASCARGLVVGLWRVTTERCGGGTRACAGVCGARRKRSARNATRHRRTPRRPQRVQTRMRPLHKNENELNNKDGAQAALAGRALGGGGPRAAAKGAPRLLAALKKGKAEGKTHSHDAPHTTTRRRVPHGARPHSHSLCVKVSLGLSLSRSLSPLAAGWPGGEASNTRFTHPRLPWCVCLLGRKRTRDWAGR